MEMSVIVAFEKVVGTYYITGLPLLLTCNIQSVNHLVKGIIQYFGEISLFAFLPLGD